MLLKKVNTVRIGSTVFFVFFGLAGIGAAGACSAPDASTSSLPDKKPSTTKDGEQKKKNGEPALSPSPQKQPTGQNEGSPKAPLVDAPNCKGRADFFACLDCCDAALPKMQSVAWEKWKSCACETCSAECKDNMCSQNPSDEKGETPQCEACLSKVGNKCVVEGNNACDADPSCAAHLKCQTACEQEFPAQPSDVDGGLGGGGDDDEQR